ncbi:MAG: AlpA family phage regulatory protein [Caldilineaceae bacterium SB0665_bin_21]|nr:AlpA family phage regulatory protein [Caldilineaceae bacterium SB0665_bin_21]
MQNIKTKLLHAREVQRACGLSKSTLYRFMRTGLFPEPLKIGPKAIRWRADEIQEWIDSRERAHGDSPKSAMPVPSQGSPSELA